MPKYVRVLGESGKKSSATLAWLIQKRSALRSGAFPATGAFSIINYAVDIRGNYVAYKARFNRKTDKTRSFYLTALVFFDIKLADKETARSPLKMEVFKGKYVFTSLPTYTRNSVKVACTCADYYWTWWFYNDEHDAYQGVQPKEPSEVTGRTERVDGKAYGDTPGSRNDAKTPGVCKHIAAMAEFLVSKKKVVK